MSHDHPHTTPRYKDRNKQHNITETITMTWTAISTGPSFDVLCMGAATDYYHRATVTYMCVWTRIFVCMSARRHVLEWVYLFMCAYVCVCMRMCVRTRIYIYEHMHEHTCVCMCWYIKSLASVTTSFVHHRPRLG